MARPRSIVAELAVVFAAFVTMVVLAISFAMVAAVRQSPGGWLIWSTVMLAATVALGVFAFGRLVYALIWPLRGVRATVRRLTVGQHAARARETGSTEAREIARAVNDQADASDRARAVEAESKRLRGVAKEGAARIREHLLSQDVLREAQAVLQEGLDSDVVCLRLLEDGRVGQAVGPHPAWVVPGDVIAELSPADAARLQAALRAQRSLVIAVRGAGGDELSARITDILRRAGVDSALITPFGVDQDLLGAVIAQRRPPSRPWSQAEIDAVESIATDLGRALHHARLYEAESRLVAELREVDQAKSEFLATVSHELRTPLTSIAGYVEILADAEPGPLNSLQRKMLESVARNTDRLRTLIEDVLTLSKIESGAFRTALEPVDLVAVVRAAVAALRPEARTRDLSVVPVLPDRAVLVSGDPGQLDRAVVNLLSNAVKFTPESGRVEVSAAADGGSAVVQISDDGIGVPASELGKLFTRFYRASNAVDRAIPGTGLGLAIVRTIMDNHGGEIELRSREGAGTTVTMRIPLLPADLP